MALNERDFSRMNLTTKMIKIIEKIQSKHSTRTTDTPQDTVDENNVSTVDVYQVEAIINPNDPYQGINLEQVSY